MEAYTGIGVGRKRESHPARVPHHRFGGLDRLLNEENLPECFHTLRKDQAPAPADQSGRSGSVFAPREHSERSSRVDELSAARVGLRRRSASRYRHGFVAKA